MKPNIGPCKEISRLHHWATPCTYDLSLPYYN